MTTLYYRDDRSDKVYKAEISDAGNGLFDVNIAYGRRGSTLTASKKNSSPLALADAKVLLGKVLREKMAKGYTEGADAPYYTATDKEDRFTGVLPMLLNSVDESDMYTCFFDDDWIAEKKFDGKRIMVRKSIDGSVEGINRKGLLVGIPEVVAEEIKKLPGAFVLDGEMVGEVYHAFDVISDKILWDRKHDLYLLMNTQPRELHPHVVEVQYHNFGAKKLFFDALRADGAEGIVFKHRRSIYRPGRPNKGGNALKFKFKARHTFMVAGCNAKRSVSLFAADDTPVGYTSVGNCTIPPNCDIPEPGNLVDVEYLYAYKGGSLFQPVYKGKRDDTAIDHIANLKYKAGEEEDE